MTEGRQGKQRWRLNSWELETSPETCWLGVPTTLETKQLGIGDVAGDVVAGE